MAEQKWGGALARRYDVRKLNDAEGKHDDCWFFVLDIRHDPYARDALYQYAVAVRTAQPGLWDDLLDMLRRTPLERSQWPK